MQLVTNFASNGTDVERSNTVTPKVVTSAVGLKSNSKQKNKAFIPAKVWTTKIITWTRHGTRFKLISRCSQAKDLRPLNHSSSIIASPIYTLSLRQLHHHRFPPQWILFRPPNPVWTRLKFWKPMCLTCHRSSVPQRIELRDWKEQLSLLFSLLHWLQHPLPRAICLFPETQFSSRIPIMSRNSLMHPRVPRFCSLDEFSADWYASQWV